MALIVKEDEAFERIEMPRDEAIKFCRDLGQKLKVEHLDEGLSEEANVSFYRQGEFIDLCRGPHVPRAGAIGAFKLLSVAGAYWKGDAQRQQLQRLYGTAFFSQKELDEHLQQLEEAKRRDHRVLGRQLELFHIDPAVGSGLVLWLPKGAIVRHELENFLYHELIRRGYQPVNTPVIGNVHLYETSGHYPYYKESQFPPVEIEEGERYLLRPMNCPHHIKIYQLKPRSYRRLAVSSGGVRDGASFRAVGRAKRHDPRPGLHAGRRPHFLHRGASGRRVPRLHRHDAVRAEDPRLGQLQRPAGLPRPDKRQVRRLAGDLGSGGGVVGAGLQ